MLDDLPLSYLLGYFLPRVLVATLVGGLIGLERELRGKVAGIKTNMLICAGSTLYTSAALLMGVEGFRIIAQIVTGIGFLGAGAIFRTDDTVKGLTTAAFIWVIGGLGIIIGSGGFLIGSLLGLGLLAAVETVAFLESKFLRLPEVRKLSAPRGVARMESEVKHGK